MDDPESAFERLVRRLAEASGWEVDDLDESGAALLVEADPGDRRVLELFPGEDGDSLFLVAPMDAAFAAADEVPHAFSTRLLQRNAEDVPGYWCLEEIDGEFVYSCVVETLTDGLEPAEFRELALEVAREAGDVERALDEFEYESGGGAEDDDGE